MSIYRKWAEECYSELNDTSERNIARIAAFLRAAAETERKLCIEDLKSIANDIHTDHEGKYKAYKDGVVAGIAAIRARKEQ